MRVSLTTFMDFAAANGPAKLSVIRQAKANYEREYRPGYDYYSYVRDEVLEVLKNCRPKDELAEVYGKAPADRAENYRECIDGFKRWMGRKNFECLEPPSALWTECELEVRINPELYVLINGSPHVIKLYWKPENLSKRQVDPALYLLEQKCAGEVAAVPAILDVRRGRLHKKTVDKRDMGLYVQTEAMAFIRLWHGLSS